MATKGKCCHFSLMNVTQNSSHNFFTLTGHFNVACKPDELKRRGGGVQRRNLTIFLHQFITSFEL